MDLSKIGATLKLMFVNKYINFFEDFYIKQ